MFATADWDEPYWTNKQHTANELAKLGWRVLYVESIGIRTPTLHSGRDLRRILRRLCRFIGGPRKVQDGIWVLSPLTIPFWHSSSYVSWLNRHLLRLFLDVAFYKIGLEKPLVWTYHPYMLSTIADEQRTKIVYHCVDDLSAIPGIDMIAFRNAERALLKRADMVFTTSEKLKAICEQDSDNVHFLPNVVDFEHFASGRYCSDIPEDLKSIPEPRIGYIGVLSDFKVDFELIYGVATSRLDWHWVLIGEEREGQSNASVKKLRALPNVHFLGYRSYRQLPQYLKGIAVGTLPTLINEYTASMFPMKYFEYIAAGVPVVSTPLAFLKQRPGLAHIASTSYEFEAHVEDLLREPKIPLMAAKDEIGRNTWKDRMKLMLQLLGERL